MPSAITDLFRYGTPAYPGILHEKIKERYEKQFMLSNGTEYVTVSEYSNTNRAPGTSSEVYKAMRMYAMMENGWTGAGVGSKKNNLLAERLDDGTSVSPVSSTVVVISTASKTVRAAKVDCMTKATMPVTFGTRAEGGAIIFLALMPKLMEDPEFNETYHQMVPGLTFDVESRTEAEFRSTTGMTVEDFGAFLARASDHIYHRITHGGLKAFEIKLEATGRAKKVEAASIKNGTYQPEPGYIGAFYALNIEGTKKPAVSKKPLEELQKMYPLGSFCTYTEEQKKRIPVIDETYSIPELAVGYSRVIYNSTFNSKLALRNFMLEGPTGTGKTTITFITSGILGLPRTVITCHIGTEIFDLLYTILPNDGTGGIQLGVMDIIANYNLPTFEDMQFDLDGSYKNLFPGKERPKGYTTEDGLRDLMERIIEIQRELLANTKDYTLQIGPLLKALCSDELVELQETRTIANPGVLVGLNSILEPNGLLTLPNGVVMRRSKYSVLFMTTNGTDYEGNTEIQGSVMSRMASYIELPNPPAEVMAANAMLQTGYADKDAALMMAKFITEAATLLDSKGVVNSCCGPRELGWWMSYVCTEGNDYIYHYAFECVINKATKDKDLRESLTELLESKGFSA